MEAVTVRSKVDPSWTIRIPPAFRGMFDLPIATDIGAQLVELFTLTDLVLEDLTSDEADLSLGERLVYGSTILSASIDRAVSWYVHAISRNN